ncbi:MAG: hypothetical protein ACXQS2_05155 [Methermicoccaceae archaeon]
MKRKLVEILSILGGTIGLILMLVWIGETPSPVDGYLYAGSVLGFSIFMGFVGVKLAEMEAEESKQTEQTGEGVGVGDE